MLPVNELENDILPTLVHKEREIKDAREKYKLQLETEQCNGRRRMQSVTKQFRNIQQVLDKKEEEIWEKLRKSSAADIDWFDKAISSLDQAVDELNRFQTDAKKFLALDSENDVENSHLQERWKEIENKCEEYKLTKETQPKTDNQPLDIGLKSVMRAVMSLNVHVTDGPDVDIGIDRLLAAINSIDVNHFGQNKTVGKTSRKHKSQTPMTSSIPKAKIGKFDDDKSEKCKESHVTISKNQNENDHRHSVRRKKNSLKVSANSVGTSLLVKNKSDICKSEDKGNKLKTHVECPKKQNQTISPEIKETLDNVTELSVTSTEDQKGSSIESKEGNSTIRLQRTMSVDQKKGNCNSCKNEDNQDSVDNIDDVNAQKGNKRLAGSNDIISSNFSKGDKNIIITIPTNGEGNISKHLPQREVNLFNENHSESKDTTDLMNCCMGNKNIIHSNPSEGDNCTINSYQSKGNKNIGRKPSITIDENIDGGELHMASESLDNIIMKINKEELIIHTSPAESDCTWSELVKITNSFKKIKASRISGVINLEHFGRIAKTMKRYSSRTSSPVKIQEKSKDSGITENFTKTCKVLDGNNNTDYTGHDSIYSGQTESITHHQSTCENQQREDFKIKNSNAMKSQIDTDQFIDVNASEKGTKQTKSLSKDKICVEKDEESLTKRKHSRSRIKNFKSDDEKFNKLPDASDFVTESPCEMSSAKPVNTTTEGKHSSSNRGQSKSTKHKLKLVVGQTADSHTKTQQKSDLVTVSGNNDKVKTSEGKVASSNNKKSKSTNEKPVDRKLTDVNAKSVNKKKQPNSDLVTVSLTEALSSSSDDKIKTTEENQSSSKSRKSKSSGKPVELKSTNVNSKVNSYSEIVTVSLPEALSMSSEDKIKTVEVKKESCSKNRKSKSTTEKKDVVHSSQVNKKMPSISDPVTVSVSEAMSSDSKEIIEAVETNEKSSSKKNKSKSATKKMQPAVSHSTDMNTNVQAMSNFVTLSLNEALSKSSDDKHQTMTIDSKKKSSKKKKKSKLAKENMQPVVLQSTDPSKNLVTVSLLKEEAGQDDTAQHKQDRQGNKYFCELCKVKSSSKVDLEMHKSGRRHRSKENQLTIEDIKLTDDSKTYRNNVNSGPVKEKPSEVTKSSLAKKDVMESKPSKPSLQKNVTEQTNSKKNSKLKQEYFCKVCSKYCQNERLKSIMSMLIFEPIPWGNVIYRRCTS